MKLFANLSFHGFGHLAQSAPVLNTLSRSEPEWRFVLQTNAPDALLQRFFTFPYTLLPNPYDIGIDMIDAFRVDVDSTWSHYREFYRQRTSLLAAQSETLRQYRPDMVFSNIGFLPTLAARTMDIPTVALCSLHWGDILKGYMTGCQEEGEIINWIDECYTQADVFLQPTPSMSMPTLSNRKAIGPISRVGKKTALKPALGLSVDDRLILINLGGVETQLVVEHWPVIDHVYWLHSHAHSKRPDVFSLSTIPDDYSNVVRSCDAIVTKPGYGNFCDAACNGLRVLYGKKPDWPESVPLQDWLHQVAPAQSVDMTQLFQGTFETELTALWGMSEKPRVKPTGIAEAVDCIKFILRKS